MHSPIHPVRQAIHLPVPRGDYIAIDCKKVKTILQSTAFWSESVLELLKVMVYNI
jgi:hypothetical protein